MIEVVAPRYRCSPNLRKTAIPAPVDSWSRRSVPLGVGPRDNNVSYMSHY